MGAKNYFLLTFVGQPELEQGVYLAFDIPVDGRSG
jgi:hypothetical protein